MSWSIIDIGRCHFRADAAVEVIQWMNVASVHHPDPPLLVRSDAKTVMSVTQPRKSGLLAYCPASRSSLASVAAGLRAMLEGGRECGIGIGESPHGDDAQL